MKATPKTIQELGGTILRDQAKKIEASGKRKRKRDTRDRPDKRTGRPTGRPRVLTEEDYGRVLQALREGQSLLKACQGKSTPDPATVLARVVSEREGFGESYAQAREIGMLVQEEQMLRTVDEIDLSTVEAKLANAEVQKVRLQIDTRKWLMSKMRPERYGDRVALTGDSRGAPIKLSNEDAAREVALLLATAAARRIEAERKIEVEVLDEGNGTDLRFPTT